MKIELKFNTAFLLQKYGHEFLSYEFLTLIKDQCSMEGQQQFSSQPLKQQTIDGVEMLYSDGSSRTSYESES
jgi:hypothetical protein